MTLNLLLLSRKCGIQLLLSILVLLSNFYQGNAGLSVLAVDRRDRDEASVQKSTWSHRLALLALASVVVDYY